MLMLLLTDSTLFFVNLLHTDSNETDRKQSLAGTVKGWAALVHEQGTSKQSSEASASEVSGFSNQPSKATKATTVSCLGTGIETHVRGFGDGEYADDRMERGVMFAAARDGKRKLSNNMAMVTLLSTESDPEARAYILSTAVKRNAAAAMLDQAEVGPDSMPDVDMDEGGAIGNSEENNDMELDSAPSQQTSVSVVHTELARPALKKFKTMEGTAIIVQSSRLQPLVGVESANTASESKTRSDYKNGDLPVPIDERWSNSFIDTVILWAGSQPNIWSIPDEDLVMALQKIFAVVYPGVQYEVTINGAVFGVAWQRLSEWRSGFGSTALVMVIHFFFWATTENPEHSEEPDATILDAARQLMSPPHYPFTHEDCENPNPERNFRSAFVLKLIATAHLSKTLGAVDVPSLHIAKLRKGHGMENVVGLAAAALERAFTLVRDSVIDVRKAVKEMGEKKGKVTVPKTLDKATGNMSKGTSMFSISNWGGATESYAIAVKNMGSAYTIDVINSAFMILDRKLVAHNELTESGVTDTKSVDPRALLWYFFVFALHMF